MPRAGFLGSVPLAAVLCAAPVASAMVAVPTGFYDEQIVPGLRYPTSLAFLPDGRVLFTEKNSGRVRMVVRGHVGSGDPLLTVPDLFNGSYEAGLQGIAVDPAWPARPYVYLFHNRVIYGPGTEEHKLRLVRYTASGQLADSAGEYLSLSQPFLIFDDLPDNHSYWNGGCLRFAPDGLLFVSLGYDADTCAAQDSTSLKGQLLRIDVSRLPPGTGGPVLRELITPPGNPLSTADSNARMVWAYGLHNPWRYHVDAITGNLYLEDAGNSRYEKIFEIHPGDNCGYPWREGPLVLSYYVTCLEPGGPGNNPFKSPIIAMGRGAGLHVGNVAFYRPVAGAMANWPAAYDGDVWYTDFYIGDLIRFEKSGANWQTPPPVPGQPNGSAWATGLDYPVEFVVGPEGSMWWLSFSDASFADSTGSLHRIVFGVPPVGVSGGTPEAATLRCAPNPFGSSTDLTFELPSPARVRLSIFDLAGRRVRQLIEGERPAGVSPVRWDGRDDAGRDTAPGLYLARLELHGAKETLRMLKLR